MFNVSRETLLFRRNIFLDLLRKWNATHNLVQEKTLDDFFSRHWDDSLQLASIITDPSLKILDIGSGAGFPGIPLSAAGYNLSLCEITSKKIAFLKIARHEIGLNYKIIDEDVWGLEGEYDIVMSRAFSNLENILKIMKKVSRETSKGIFLKGKKYKEEVENARTKFLFDLKIYPSQTSLEGVILEISNLQEK